MASQPITRLDTTGDELSASSNPGAQLSARPKVNASGQARFAAEHNSSLQVRRDNSQSHPVIVSNHLGPVPDGDRLRLADAVTWQLCLLPLGQALYARLGSWGAARSRSLFLLLSISYSHSRLGEARGL